MTRIDFFQIDGKESMLAFACRLVDKAYHQKHKIYVHTESASDSGELDDLLWTFRLDRFIPHALHSSGITAPVHIGHEDDPGEHRDVLVNLSGKIPHFFSRFERVTEVVPEDDLKRKNARENFRFYRDRGYRLEYHNLGKS
jgi:DNA polymerase-3 subunit chi